jgi:Domain of unknown function (DUF6908)
MRLPTIAAILKNHPSSDDDCLHLSIENPPYMRLVIEDVGLGPNERPAISVAHYFEQNGDLCQDPEMCFEVERQSDEFTFNPYMFQQAIPPVYQEITSNSTGSALRKQLEIFAARWDKNIGEQGFLKAANAGEPSAS